LFALKLHHSLQSSSFNWREKMTKLETHISGIPCLIAVTNYKRVKGSFSRNAPSDMDYHGYTESEWEVCDRRGRPAPWLERKLDDAARDRIEEEISEFMEE
jgi:hypothetical protein